MKQRLNAALDICGNIAKTPLPRAGRGKKKVQRNRPIYKYTSRAETRKKNCKRRRIINRRDDRSPYGRNERSGRNGRELAEVLRERYRFSFSKSRIGRWHALRVFLLVLGAAGLAWYAKVGAERFVIKQTILISGTIGADVGDVIIDDDNVTDDDVVNVDDDNVIGGDVVIGGDDNVVNVDDDVVADSNIIPADGVVITTDPDGAIWHVADLFGDGVVTARLTNFAGVTAAQVDSSIIISDTTRSRRSQYRERIDLMIVPSLNADEVLAVRENFRPRLIAVIPPCAKPTHQNIICENADEDGKFSYTFEIRRGRIRHIAKTLP